MQKIARGEIKRAFFCGSKLQILLKMVVDVNSLRTFQMELDKYLKEKEFVSSTEEEKGGL